MSRKLAGVLVFIVFASACGGGVSSSSSSSSGDGGSNSPQNGQPYKLPSGQQVKVINVGQVSFRQGAPALMLTYETQASFDDKAALRREADDIWEGLKKEAEAARLKAGVIRAVHAGDDGTTQTTQGYGFAFVKREDGKWHNLEDEKRGN